MGTFGARISGPITGSIARSDALLSLGSSASRAVLMGVILLGPLWLRAPFANVVTARLAPFAYGIYLIHFVVIAYAARYLGLPEPPGAAGLLLWCLVVGSISLAYAAVAHRLVERPAIEWVRRRASRPPAERPPAGLSRA